MPKKLDTIEYVLEPDDIIFFNTLFAKKFGALKNRTIGAFCFGGVALAVFLFWLFSDGRQYSDPLRFFIIAFLCFAIYVVYSFLFLPMSLTRQAKTLFFSGADYCAPRSAEFYTEVFRVSKKFVRETYDWKDVKYCCDSMTHFCLYFGDEPSGEVLPKSVLTQQQTEQLSNMLCEMLKEKYIKI